MRPADNLERQLEESWARNAEPWIDAVRNHRIPSRRAGTDRAVVEAVLAFPPCAVLDLGCGEGWLARVLTQQGYQVTGVDGSPALIESARASGGGEFLVRSFAQMIEEPDGMDGPFDLIVANFALLGQDVLSLLGALKACLTPGGSVLIQTLHPNNGASESGWRVEDFAALGEGFQPMPYYFRTFNRWTSDLALAGFQLVRSAEPADENGRPLSVLLQFALR